MMTRKGIAAVTALASMVLLVWGASAQAAPRATQELVQQVTISVYPVKGGEFVSPMNLAVRPGQPIAITFRNYTAEFHTFTVPGLGISAIVLPGSTASPRVTRLRVVASKSGVFQWYCVLCKAGAHDGHEMGGKLYAIIDWA